MLPSAPAGEAGGEVVMDGLGLLDVLAHGIFDGAVKHQGGGEGLAAGQGHGVGEGIGHLQHWLIDGTDRFYCCHIHRQLVDVDEGRDQVGVVFAVFQGFLDEADGLVAHFQQFLPFIRGELDQVRHEFGLEGGDARLDFCQVGFGDIERNQIFLTHGYFPFLFTILRVFVYSINNFQNPPVG